MNEVWKIIPDWIDYEVSTLGRVRWQGRLLKGHITTGGYQQVCLCKQNSKVKKFFYVHRLVLLAFIGPSKLVCNHKNHVKRDNRLENLEYVTGKENSAKAALAGRYKGLVGESNPGVKLEASQVLQIRKRLAEGETQQSIADDYEVARSGISLIGSRKTWKHL